MFYNQEELNEIGFAKIGKNVSISKKTSIYNPKNISIGDNVRIDDFCILSAGEKGIILGNHIHIACYCLLVGKEMIQMDDFTGISSRVSLYSSSDDYSGRFLTNPTIPKEFTNVQHGKIQLKKHVIIGSGSVVLPGVTIEEGVAIGALSLVTKNIESFVIATGIPAKVIKKREKNLLEKEKEFFSKMKEL